jgi:hypothetical protein
MPLDKNRLANVIKGVFDDFEQQAQGENPPTDMKTAISLALAEAIVNEVKLMTITISANAGATPVTFVSIAIT